MTWYCIVLNRTQMRVIVRKHLKVTRGVPWDPTTVFAYFTTIASNVLTGVVYNCHPTGYTPFDEKKINQIGLGGCRIFFFQIS